jgi:hypothetical protein
MTGEWCGIAVGAVDATFLAQMILVLQAVPPGDIVQEEVADERTYAPGNALVDERLQTLGTSGLSLVRDRAKARIPRAAQGVQGLRRPAFLPGMPDMVQRYARPLGRRMRQARQALLEAQEAVARLQGRPAAAQEAPVAQVVVGMRPTEVTRWEEAHHI